jgi:hypothetical protein
MKPSHAPEGCARCQRDLALYGEALIDAATGEHLTIVSAAELSRAMRENDLDTLLGVGSPPLSAAGEPLYEREDEQP